MTTTPLLNGPNTIHIKVLNDRKALFVSQGHQNRMKERQSTRHGISTVFGPLSSGVVVIIGDIAVGIEALVVDLELGGGDAHAVAAGSEGSLQSVGDSADAGLLLKSGSGHSSGTRS